MKYRIIFTLSIIIFIASSCKKPEKFPDEPVLTFKDIYTVQNAQGYDNNIVVLLAFTDGDGDVGYNEPGSNDPIFDNPNSQYYNNYIVKTFRLLNGVWWADTINLSGRMLYLTPDVQNKTLKGEIKRELPVPPAQVNDTFRFDIFIYDRSFHQSNTITTPDIVLNTQ